MAERAPYRTFPGLTKAAAQKRIADLGGVLDKRYTTPSQPLYHSGKFKIWLRITYDARGTVTLDVFRACPC